MRRTNQLVLAGSAHKLSADGPVTLRLCHLLVCRARVHPGVLLAAAVVVTSLLLTTGAQAAALPTKKLAWAPPRLRHPTTIHISSPTKDLYLDPSRDYILKMPSTPVKPGDDGGLWVSGGHNIVIVGGEFDFNGVVNTDPVNEKEGRVATFYGVTGTIHMEGIWAHGNGLIEGVDMYSPRATLQIENCRFDHLHTEANGYHSDLVQWGTDGGKALRIDRFTGSSEVQGISDFGQPAAFDLRQVNILGLSGANISSPVLGWLQASSVALQDFYVQPRPGESLLATLRPYGGKMSKKGTVTWRGGRIRGSVHRGRPPHGDYVPRRVVGIHYKSPGYF